MTDLLGPDVSQLPELLSEKWKTEHEDALVVTRAEARRQQQQLELEDQRQKDSGVHPNPINEREKDEVEPSKNMPQELQRDEQTTEPFNSFDNELFGTTKPRSKITRTQNVKTKYTAQTKEIPMHKLDMAPDEFKALQHTDPSLAEIAKAAKGTPLRAVVGFFEKDGLLYRRWLPPNCSEEHKIEQLVLPTECRIEAFEVAHSIPMVGHGKNKTVCRLL